MAYLQDELNEYCGGDAYPFHMPGHKRRLNSMGDPFKIDITEIDGFDNLHHAEGLLLEAQKRAAKLYGSGETHFLINGSTAGILAAIGACSAQSAGRLCPDTGRREAAESGFVPAAGRATLVMARNSHKAAYHAAEINGLKTVYLCPETAGEINGPILPGEVERVLREQFNTAGAGYSAGRVCAVFITSPTYDGVVSDVRAIAQAVHRYGIPLIVDEAHGAHFGMHPVFPQSSVRLGADLVIHSVHKTLPSLTQTALIHVNGPLVDRRRLHHMLDIYQTSSPSYILMASIDSCIRILDEEGGALFNELAENLGDFYSSMCGKLKTFSFIRTDDPSKILIRPHNMTAKELYSRLRLDYKLQPEMAARSYVLMICSVGDTAQGFARLKRALLEMDDISGMALPKADEARGRAFLSELPDTVMTIAEASDSDQERVHFAEAAGRISAEYLYLYPPGIPLTVPGERIDRHLIRQAEEYLALGWAVEGAEDYSLESVWVLR